MNRPETLDDWGEYAATLKGPALTSKLRTLNSQTFTDMILAEGYDMDHVKKIVIMMSVQQLRTGASLPSIGAWDLEDLVRNAFPDGVGVLSNRQIAAITPTEEPPDQYDAFLDGSDLEDQWGPTDEEEAPF